MEFTVKSIKDALWTTPAVCLQLSLGQMKATGLPTLKFALPCLKRVSALEGDGINQYWEFWTL